MGKNCKGLLLTPIVCNSYIMVRKRDKGSSLPSMISHNSFLANTIFVLYFYKWKLTSSNLFTTLGPSPSKDAMFLTQERTPKKIKPKIEEKTCFFEFLTCLYMDKLIEHLCARNASKAHPSTKLAPSCSRNHSTTLKFVEVAKMSTTTPQFAQFKTWLIQSLKLRL